VYAALILSLFAADVETPVKIEASGPWQFAKVDTSAKGSDAKQLVIRSADDFAKEVIDPKKAGEQLNKVLKVKAIDWDKEMLLVVTAGTKRSGGFRVEITEVKSRGDTLTVYYKVTPPKGAATRAVTHPGAVVVVPKHKGKVVFEQAK
jgi:hypothetical protein